MRGPVGPASTGAPQRAAQFTITSRNDLTMRMLKLLSLAGLAVALSSTANAQFSASGAGAAIPASGTGGGGTAPDVALPPSPAVSTAAVGVAVSNIDSIVIDGLSHTWIGDLQMTLSDPNGVEHLFVMRPGSTGTSAGNSGDFTGATYTFVETGGVALPTTGDAAPGTYDQSFDTGNGFAWTSGTLGINNTPLSAISGPAGNWTLTIYDWAGGDTGSFSGWTLNGNGGGGGNTGAAYCFGDGTGTACPCAAFGGIGEGCLTTSGTGATLAASGNADVANDTFQLDVSGAPANKPGLFFQGDNQLATVTAGDGVLCSNSTLRYGVNSTDAGGNVTQTGFGANAAAGTSLNYQYWFRDTGNPCGGGFNFSNGWNQAWN